MLTKPEILRFYTHPFTLETAEVLEHIGHGGSLDGINQGVLYLCQVIWCLAMQAVPGSTETHTNTPTHKSPCHTLQGLSLMG